MENSIHELFFKYLKGTASKAEIDQVLVLIREDRYAEEWNAALLAFESDFQPEDQHPEDPNQWLRYQKIKKRLGLKSPPPFRWISYAAAALLIFASTYLIYRLNSSAIGSDRSPVGNIVQKTTSGHKWIKLADGTSVQLNANSHLEYPLSFQGNRNREVTLVGEAFFDVAHDQQHPFIIHTGKVTTTVLGTAFNISAYQNQESVVVTVTRGKVMVQSGNKTLAILMPNQQLSWNSAQKTIAKNRVNAQHALAWKAQDLIMDDISMDAAAELIAKRFNIEVVFKNNQVKKCRFTAAFLERNDIEQVTQVISSITGVRFERSGNKLLIDGEGCEK